MYVDPFWDGVIATVFVELLGLFILALSMTGGKK